MLLWQAAKANQIKISEIIDSVLQMNPFLTNIILQSKKKKKKKKTADS